MARLTTTLLACVLWLEGASWLQATPPASTEVGTIGIDELSPGMRGYGYSVFRGVEPQRFEVEVLGLLRNQLPDTSFILVRLMGPEVEQGKVIQGMSGSPVYFDGRLAGAVSFGWGFSTEAIAGLMPIAQMHDLERSPASPVVVAAARQALGARLSTDEATSALVQRLESLRPALPSGAVSAWGWTGVGFGAGASSLLERALGPVAMAGTATTEPPPLAPGTAVAALLFDGDLRLAATGTVSDRRGDRIYAFGHPFLGNGEVAFPMASAEVVTVVNSVNISFKLANVGPVVGAFRQDRRAGILGELGAEAPMIPVHVRFEGDASRDFDIRVAHIKGLSAALIGTAVLNCIEVSSARSGNQALDIEVNLDIRGKGRVSTSQSFDGEGAATQVAGWVLGVADQLLESAFARVELDGVEVRVRQATPDRQRTVERAFLDRTTARPGETVRMFVDLVPYRGEPLRESLELELPASLSEGRYFFVVGDGSTVSAARLVSLGTTARTLDDELDTLRSLRSRRELVVLGFVQRPGAAVGGDALPRLPASVRTLWGKAGPPGGTATRVAFMQELVKPLDAPIQGMVRVELMIEKP